MILVRSPLRITLGGGGTDLPYYANRYGGFALTAAIDHYVYITVHNSLFFDDLVLKYSKMERVASADQVQHPIVREALRMAGLRGNGLEIVSIADIPAGTGLGSSSSFATGLLKALYSYTGANLPPLDLAEKACSLEIDILHEHIGKQDQYTAAYGGINSLEFFQDGTVQVVPVGIAAATRYNLEDNLLLFFTGHSRSASAELSQQSNTLYVDKNLHTLKDIAHRSHKALTDGHLQDFAELLDEQYANKRQRSRSVIDDDIHEMYCMGRNNGALGGKLVGAGGGGFLLFYAEDKIKLRHCMAQANLHEVRFRFDLIGTTTVIHT